MFERYTEKARRVIFFARYEASQFGSRLIESEHILLGLFREDRALANRFLPHPTTIESIRAEVEAKSGIREKIPTSVDLPLSDDCKRILALAAEPAARFEHTNIAPGHLLFGMLHVENCFGSQILRGRGLDLDEMHEWLTNPRSQPPVVVASSQVRLPGIYGVDLERYSLKAARAISLAQAEAGRFASSTVEAEHLLLGLVREDQTITKRLLHSERAAESIRKQVESNNERRKSELNAPHEEMAGLRKVLREIRQRIEAAIENHEFEKARFYSDEEKVKRDALYRLAEKYHLEAFPAEEAPSSGLPLSEQCRRVLHQGAEEATLLKQRYIGTEHLLLGILREEKSFAADILHESGLQLAQTREEIARWSQEQGGDHV